MNPYVGREEKEHLVRITALAIMLNNIIDIYAQLKSTDKQFLSHLRKSRTWLNHAISLRQSYLTAEASRDLCRSVEKMRLLFVPSDKAKKEHEEMLKLKSVFPFEMDDFNNLYAELIETTCKVCVRADYADCQARRVMAKYGVFPYNPAATATCQFSYMDPAVPLAANQEESAPISEQEPLPEQATVAATDVTLPPTADAEQPEPVQDGLLTVRIGLISGQLLTLRMDDYMARHLLTEIKRPSRRARGTVACSFGGNLVAVDMTEVASIQADGLPDSHWIRQPEAAPAPYQEALRPVQRDLPGDSTERYCLKCKCGSTYFLTLQAGQQRGRCRYCRETVFADRQAEPIVDWRDNTTATLMTNTYYVPQPKPDNLPPVSPAAYSGQRGYHDPCNPFT